jgi:hypothetical protein
MMIDDAFFKDFVKRVQRLPLAPIASPVSLGAQSALSLPVLQSSSMENEVSHQVEPPVHLILCKLLDNSTVTVSLPLWQDGSTVEALIKALKTEHRIAATRILHRGQPLVDLKLDLVSQNITTVHIVTSPPPNSSMQRSPPPTVNGHMLKADLQAVLIKHGVAPPQAHDLASDLLSKLSSSSSS